MPDPLHDLNRRTDAELLRLAGLQMALLLSSEQGAELKAVYLVMGRYDFVALVEAPDEATAAKAALALGSKGNVSSETLRAFTEDEFRSIVSRLP